MPDLASLFLFCRKQPLGKIMAKVKKMSSLFVLFGYLLPYKSRLIAASCALIFTAAITLAIGQGVRILIDEGFVGGSQDQLNKAIGFIVLLAFFMSIGTFIRFYLVSWLGERVSADIRLEVFNHIITLHPSYFETNRSGEIMSRLTTDTTLLQSIIGSSVSMALRSSLTMAGALLMLLVTNFKLTMMVLGVVPIVLVPILFYGRKVRTLSRQSQDTIANVGTYAGEIIQNIKTVQSYTQENTEKSSFAKEVENAFSVARRRVSQRAWLIAVVILLVFSALSAMLWVGGRDVLAGNMSGGDLGAFVFYAIIVASGVATLSEVFGELQRAAGATDRLVELMEAPSEILAPEKGAIAPISLAAELSFDKVNFCYPSRPDELALDDFSLLIEEGKSLALVGPSGAGKSTVFELLQRFYDPQSGHVNLAQEDIRQFDPHDLRQQLAVVSQQPALFSADVSYNIRYGKPDATDAEVEAAARAAYAHEFICKLPEGYGSFLGEQGVRLSGGQRQRVAIARAILKDPRILLLDEATSALDAESEHQVQLALEKLMQNRTTIIIAHRLSTILHADKIAVLDRGKIVATGKHSELMQSSELYQRLAKLQFDSHAS
jgi:ATP-binding cassette subfamily B protein|tara:strand:+ start:6239 stop:8053 length:1815 start_codon:yes stop_codon:yes gene_type:complete